jgi:L-2-hydroxyglutarate oxidase
VAPPHTVVGGGIIGAAVARRLLPVRPDAQVTLLEEDRLAGHQTGRNSGVVHAGLYYEPGSLKATLCRRGIGLLKEFCAETGLAYDEVGKVLVALHADERQRLDAIAERARANGVPGIRVIGRAELHELEPQAATSSLAIAEHIVEAILERQAG